MLKEEHAAFRATFTYCASKTCSSWIVMYVVPSERMRICLTSGQYDDAEALGDAPIVVDCVADGASEAVLDAVEVTLTVFVTDTVRETVILSDIDIDVDAVAPSVSEPVDVALVDGVAEVDTEMLYEGDAAHHAGMGG